MSDSNLKVGDLVQWKSPTLRKSWGYGIITTIVNPPLTGELQQYNLVRVYWFKENKPANNVHEVQVTYIEKIS